MSDDPQTSGEGDNFPQKTEEEKFFEEAPEPKFVDKIYHPTSSIWFVIQEALGEQLTPTPASFRIVRAEGAWDNMQIEEFENNPDFVDPKITPILMSAKNPNGWTLQNLCPVLIEEIREKSSRIANDNRPVAKIVLSNNLRIIEFLDLVAKLTAQSMEYLAMMGKNEGPLGKPRIGEGSDHGPK
jgi:hypothetical protein